MTKCPHCLKPIKKSYLVKHIGRFHPDIPKQRVSSIVCSVCENKFRYRQEFRDHVEKAHAKITRTDLKLKNWDGKSDRISFILDLLLICSDEKP